MFRPVECQTSLYKPLLDVATVGTRTIADEPTVAIPVDKVTV
nr:hypothetical protein [Mesorhizobium sp.]